MVSQILPDSANGSTVYDEPKLSLSVVTPFGSGTPELPGIVPPRGVTETEVAEFTEFLTGDDAMRLRGYIVKAQGWIDSSSTVEHRFAVLQVEHRVEQPGFTSKTYYMRIDRRPQRHMSRWSLAVGRGKSRSSDRVVFSYDVDELLALSKKRGLECALNLKTPVSLEVFGPVLEVIHVQLANYNLVGENCWSMASVILEELGREGHGTYVHGSPIPNWAPREVRARIQNLTKQAIVGARASSTLRELEDLKRRLRTAEERLVESQAAEARATKELHKMRFEAFPAVKVFEGHYSIQSEVSGAALEMRKGWIDYKAPITIEEPCFSKSGRPLENDLQPGWKYQAWDVILTEQKVRGQRRYIIRNLGSGMVIDLWGGNPAPSQPVHGYELNCNNGFLTVPDDAVYGVVSHFKMNQLWDLLPHPSKAQSFRIRCLMSGTFLDSRPGATGTPVTCDHKSIDLESQLWTFVKLDM